ncbi:MAG: substrate-binding domain-containing protein [Candidatus Limnocylindria bacterium]
MSRRVAVLLPVLAIVLAACQQSASESAAPGESAAAVDCKVGVSWNNYQQERWAKADEPAMQDVIEAAGGEYFRTDAQDSEEQQIADVESLINQEVDVIILLAKSTTSILPAVDAAEEAGIPIIGYDRLIARDSVFYITFDNAGVGRFMAEAMLEAVPTGNYVVIKGHPDDPNADFLRAGMDEGGLADAVAAGDVTIVFEEYTDTWSTENAQANMETALQENDNEVDAVLSENDSMAIGVVAALDKVGLAGTVPVSGQDGDPANLKNVAQGLQYVDVWKNSNELGKAAGQAALQLCEGRSMEEIEIDIDDSVAPTDGNSPTDFETPGGITVSSLILQPTPVTAETLDLVVAAGWYASKDDICAGVTESDPGFEDCQ